jgi:hypothetical protein
MNATKEFKKRLDLKKGTYLTDVFTFYVNNNKDIKNEEVEKELKFFKKIIENLIAKNNPIDIGVRITSDLDKPKSYKIASYTHYYGDVMKCAQLLIPNKLPNYTKHILNYIPFAYSIEQQTILEIVKNIDDKDLKDINKLYLDHRNHARYLMPSSYIYMIKTYISRGCHLKSPKEVLKDFVIDDNISVYDRQSSLNLLERFLNKDSKRDRDFIDGLISSYGKFKSEEDIKMVATIRASLVSIFEDPESINWFFEELKKRYIKTQPDKERSVGSRSVSDIESELSHLSFAKPLTELKDPKYLDQFKDLLEFSFTKLKGDEEGYKVYSEYLQKVFIEYLKNANDLVLMNKTKNWAETIRERPLMNWFILKVQEARSVLFSESSSRQISKAIKFLEA